MRLQALVARQAVRLAYRQRRPQPRRGVVRGADRQHLARGNELAEYAQHVFERRRRVVVVRLIVVDPIGP
jgi:hypothetical protein